MGTPNREPQEYSRSITGIYLPGSSYSIIFLLYSWHSLFGVPIKNPVFMHEYWALELRGFWRPQLSEVCKVLLGVSGNLVQGSKPGVAGCFRVLEFRVWG